jgi:hypothetical protein
MPVTDPLSGHDLARTFSTDVWQEDLARLRAAMAATQATTTPGAWTVSAEYPLLVSVRGSRPVPARKEGRYFWLRHEMHLGIVWRPGDITVLETADTATAHEPPPELTPF